MLYSYKNSEPTPLPQRFRLSDGSTRTSLYNLSQEELFSLGFFGPIEKPEYDESIQKIEWTGTEYVVSNMNDSEIQECEEKRQEKLLKDRRSNVNYAKFWEAIVETYIYTQIRNASATSLAANTICTEVISLFNDAKNGNPNEEKIQFYLNVMLLEFDFVLREVEVLESLMRVNNLDSVYTLPDENFLVENTYDFASNSIVKV